MDATLGIITQFIQNTGFPIAVVVYLFFAQREQNKQHEEETKGFVEAINNNTNVITRLTDKLESLEKEIEK